MNKVIDTIKNNKWIHYGLIIIIGIIISLPLYNVQISKTHDGELHFLRLLGTVDTLKIGQIPPLVNPNYCNGAGYAMNLFYAPIVTYAPLILKLFTNNYFSALKVYGAICTILSGITMYHFTYTVTKKKSIALFASIFYILAPYKLANVYKRYAIGEFTASIFIPFVFLGLYNLFEQDRKKHYYIAIGAIAIILSHTVSTLYIAIFSLIYVLVNIKKLKDKDIIKKCFINGFFILIITMFFYIPLFEASSHAEYGITNNEIMGATGETAQTRTVNILEFIKYDTTREEGWEVTVVLGVITIITFICTCIVNKFIEEKYKNIYLLSIIFAIVSLFMATYLFPWKIMPDILCELQFPWRMIGYATFFISFVCGINLYHLIKIITKEDKIKLLITISVITIMIIESFGVLRNFFVDDYTWDEKYQGITMEDTKISHKRINREYMPYKALKLQDTYVMDRDGKTHILEGEGEILEENNYGNLTDQIKIKNVKSKALLEFPYYYYVGYDITLQVEGKEYKFAPIESQNGYLACILEEDIEDGIIKVEYKGTILQKTSYIVSILGLIAFITYIIYEKRKNKDGERNV